MTTRSAVARRSSADRPDGTAGDLASLRLRLKCTTGACRLPAASGFLAYGAVLRAVSRVDQDLARRLHATRTGALSVSEPCRPAPTPDQASPPDTVEVRLASLDGPTSDLLREWSLRPPPSLRFGRIEFETLPCPSDSLLRSSCNGLLESWSRRRDAPRQVALRFISPTTFRAGKVNLPLPLPRLVFTTTLLEKWWAHAPAEVAREVCAALVTMGVLPPSNLPGRFVAGAVFEGSVLLSRHRISSCLRDFTRHGKGMSVGFLGEATFTIRPDTPDPGVRALQLLADFAEFAGVGSLTAWGLGQVRRAGRQPTG
jgi:hypothetical protein